MANNKLCQKWHRNKMTVLLFTNNKELSSALVEQLHDYYEKNVVKHVAHDLQINVCTVKNWFYKKSGLKAYDLLCLLDNYKCIRDLLGFSKVVMNDRLTGKINRKKICKKILDLLCNNPKMSMNELALALEITPKAVEWKLYQLVKEKKIERTGSPRNGRWIVLR